MNNSRGNLRDKPNMNNNSSGGDRGDVRRGIDRPDGDSSVAALDKPRTTTRDALGKPSRDNVSSSLNDSSRGSAKPRQFNRDGLPVDEKPSAAVRSPIARVDDLHTASRARITNTSNVNLSNPRSFKDPSVVVHDGGFHHDDFHHGDFHHDDFHHGDFHHDGFHHDDFHHHDFCHSHFWGCSSFCSPCWGWGWGSWCGSGWGFSIGFSSCNFGFGWGWGSSWCYPHCYYPYYSYYSPWWYSAPYDYGYQPTYVTNNYYDSDGSYSGGSSGYTSSDYNDYSWMDDGKSDDYRWLEDNNTPPTSRSEAKSGGLVEVWSAPAKDQSTVDEGWNELANGDPHEARRVFMRAADASPKDGAAQVGFALASGRLERYDEAVMAMRRALRLDAESLNKVPNADAVVETINTMLDHYKGVLKQTQFDIDAMFMSASLEYMIGQDALAYFTVDNAIEHGDKDESASNLKTLVREALNKSVPPATSPKPQTAPSTLNPGPAISPAPLTPPPASAPVEKQEVPF